VTCGRCKLKLTLVNVTDCSEVTMSDLNPERQSGPATSPISFKIIGVERQTGNDFETVVTALTEANARVKAELKGIVVTDVIPVRVAEKELNDVLPSKGPPAGERPATQEETVSQQRPRFVEPSPQLSPPAHKEPNKIKYATVIYALPLIYLLVTSANEAWTGLPKDHERYSSGALIATCIANTLIGFTNRLRSPIGLVCLAIFSLGWVFKKMDVWKQLEQKAATPPQRTADILRTDTAQAPNPTTKDESLQRP
jgi:hypothetical protein